MTRIAVCDDHQEILRYVENCLNRVAMDCKEYIEVETFSNGQSFCTALEKGRPFDLLILDIELNDNFNGLELCRQIREGYYANPDIPVIFISGKEGYHKELTSFYPLYFIPKPIEYQRFFNVVSTALKLEMTRQAMFAYNAAHEGKRIPIHDILYFESKGRRINLISKNGIDTFYGRLDSIQETLKSTLFLRIHKSYLVNVEYVETVQFETMTLWNGTVLPISQSKQKTIRQIMAEM